MTAADAASSVEQGMMRVLAHTPAIARSVSVFGGGLFAARTLSRRLIELVRAAGGLS